MRAWLFTIMRNQRANDLRRTIRQGLRIGPSEVQEPRVVSGGQEANEEIRDMCRALAQLSENTRAVVLLAGCHQLSYGEIVDRLKIPIGTVRSRLARGRRLLREVIADEHIDSRTVGYKSDDPANRSIGSICNEIPAHGGRKHRCTERTLVRESRNRRFSATVLVQRERA
jgi:hypothetical protein